MQARIMKFLSRVGFCIVFVMFLCSCSQDAVPRDIEQTYVNYMEAAKTDNTAEMKYCHFENPDWQVILDTGNNYVKDYEILSWNKLSNKLWAVSTKVELAFEQTPDEGPYYHFVGEIDGKYYVMIGVHNIPESLKGNLNMDSYISTDDRILN